MAAYPWPQAIMYPFESLPDGAQDTEFYGPYNKLLYHLFPADTNFVVSPGVYPPRNTDPAVEFTVFYNHMPVLLLQIKPPDHLRWASAREQADTENRRRLRDLVPLCPLPKLYALSAFGTKLRFYAAANEGIDPPASPLDARNFVADTIPASRWNSDILEEEGANLLKQTVAEIIARIYLADDYD
ncbi:hypothetical protein DFH07DRAFT_1056609 [Mycena maculata]|uniref:Uncharacterized protein n=1 Tax=Mycena maculata TaxID=230809 RepID=A0AAD7K2L8_9AGAR|nr:hypothetical protein DFH07DRAFT_1056609 [Mycena maculata]